MSDSPPTQNDLIRHLVEINKARATAYTFLAQPSSSFLTM